MATYDERHNLLQVFPLQQGKVNLTSGTHDVERLIHCAYDGDITVEWEDGATDTILMFAGEDYGFSGEITINSGKFHIC